MVLARRKLRHYFEAHPVIVVSSFPLGEIARNREAEGRIPKWSVELMGETLTYADHLAILPSASRLRAISPKGKDETTVTG